MVDTQKYQELRGKTIPGIFLDKVKSSPDEVAYRAKKLGIYRERTWRGFHHAVSCCAAGLSGLGLKHGDRLALMGDPCEEYTICELAAQSLGAITYGIYPTSSSAELLHVMEDGMASMFVAGNQEYLDRILPFSKQLSHLRQLIAIDTKGMFGHNHTSDPSAHVSGNHSSGPSNASSPLSPLLISYEKLLDDGRNQSASSPDAFDSMVKKLKATDGLSIVYTSGTTGRPRGVLISHGKHLSGTYALIDHYPVLLQGSHRTVVYLPLCTLMGKANALTLPLLAPVIPHYGEDVDEPAQVFFEIAPTVLFTVPNYLKRFASTILIDIENSTPLKRLAYSMAVSVGNRRLHDIWEKKRNLLTECAYRVCYYAVFRPILNKIGFNRLKIALSTGAPLPAKLKALWQIFGLNLSEAYGMAEMGGGIIAAQDTKFPKPGDVGRPLACLEVMLSDSGEVLVRGEELFECYWNNQELTDQFRDIEGWLRTEDAGEWTPEGRLKIVDRISDAACHPEKKRVSLTAIEGALKASPYISEAVVVGKERAYLASLIEVDFEAVSDWASRNNITFTGFTNLIENPATVDRIGREIERINSELEPHEQIKAFRIIPGELSSSEDEALVTPTRKIKRQAVQKKFVELIESMYATEQ